MRVFAGTDTFRVKNVDAFKSEMDKHGIKTDIWSDNSDNLVMIHCNGNNWPIEIYSLVQIVSTHLMDDSVAIFRKIYEDGYDLLNSSAIAVNSKGDTVELDMDDIITMSKGLINDSRDQE